MENQTVKQSTSISGDMLLMEDVASQTLYAGQPLSVNLPFVNFPTIKGVVDRDVRIVRGSEYRVVVVISAITFNTGGFHVEKRIRLIPVLN
jgi:hypothetical protein